MCETTGDRSGTATVAALAALLPGLDQAVDDSIRVDRIRALEELKSVVAAAQVRETAAFAASQSAAGQPARSVAGQVGLARRISPHHAGRYVGWASILTRELPHTYAALAAGRTSEWRALIIARETIWLSREHRAVVDAELAPRLEQLGDRRVEAEARKIGYRLDPAGFVDRARAAANDRCVTLRPAPDAMARLTALVPVAQGVAAYSALCRAADTGTAAGDPRGRGQIMADTLVERVTGQVSAGGVPVEVQLVMSTDALFNGGSEPAHVDSYGPVPAPLARSLVLDAPESTRIWLRRLFAGAHTGQLIAMDSRRRAFPTAQRRFVRARDQYCRTPYCEAPIRHADHIRSVAAGGPTGIRNGQGHCAACNHTKEARGWRATVVPSPGGMHEVEITTPTRHRYRSRPPDLPGRRRLQRTPP